MKKYGRTRMSGGQIGLSILCGFLALVLVAMIFVTAYANHYLSLIATIPNDETTISPEAFSSMMKDWYTEETDPSLESGETYTTLPTVHPTDVTEPTEFVPSTIIKHKDLVNILLVGQDRRPDESNRHLADTMIVVSVNTQDKTITLTSFMRDLYVNIPGYGYSKMNAAYKVGGFSKLCETLMSNFGVHIDGCVEVDFEGFTAVIDTLGGVEVELSESEATGLNKLNGWNLVPGVNRLDGEHALGYARVRKGFGDDYARTERQRKLVTAVLEQSKTLSVTEIMALLEEMLPIFATNMTKKQIVNYIIELFPLLSQAQVEQLRIPANGAYESVKLSSVGSCLIPDLAKNQKLLVDKLLPD